jgi:LysR family glycine cleavage system transcriptional activator
MKRLHGFRDSHPDIMIELVSRDLNDSYLENKADVIITFDEPDHLPGVEQRLIFGENMIAVCAPGYIKTPLQDNADLLHHRLLHLTQGIHGQDWASFLGRAAGDIGAPISSDRFTSFIIYLQAVLNGDGIALGWEHLLDDHLASGSLVRAANHVHRSNRGYFACLTKRAQTNTAARDFVTWIASLATDQAQSG